ncbi:MAG: universal stress protein [Deltaproteobacteria bacterium]|nr:universal stress protein [Deltaproteobacteria bacterium]
MFERVLIPTDLSLESDKIFDYALNLSGLKEVVAAHSVEASAYELIKERISDEPEEAVSSHGINPSAVEAGHLLQEIKRREERLSEKGKRLRDAGIKFRAVVHEGNMTDMAIVELAEKENASLILLGSHGKSPLEEILYGSVSEKVARKATVPVLIVRYELFDKTAPADLAANTFRKVLFPTDLKPGSDKVVDLLQLIKPEEVTVLYSVQQQEEEEEEDRKVRNKKLANVQTELGAAGIKAEVILCHGDILEDILEASEGASSVVMASHGKGVLKEWLTGSISLNVARMARVPVLFAHEGDVSF